MFYQENTDTKHACEACGKKDKGRVEKQTDSEKFCGYYHSFCFRRHKGMMDGTNAIVAMVNGHKVRRIDDRPDSFFSLIENKSKFAGKYRLLTAPGCSNTWGWFDAHHDWVIVSEDE